MAKTIGAFKKLGAGDYQIQAFKVHKTWKFDEASVDNRDINVFKGELNNKVDLAARTGSDREMKATKDTIYREIRHLYYGSNPNTGSGLNATIVGNGQHAESPFYTFGSNNDNCWRNLQSEHLTWILTPQLVFGEEIKPGSVVLKDYSTGATIQLQDDGKGNLYDLVDSASVSALDQKTTEFLYEQNYLVGYWSMNGTLRDKSLNSHNDGVHSGTATYTSSAAYHQSLTFVSESGDEVTLGTKTGSWTNGLGHTGSYAFSNDTNFTLSVWAKKNPIDPDQPDAGDLTNTMGVFGRAGLYGIDYYFTGSNQQVRAGVRGNNSQYQITHNFTDDMTGSFNHLCMTYATKSLSGMKFYVNGTLVGTKSTVSLVDFSGSEANATNAPLQLGGNGTLGGSPDYFNGWLDEARVYNRTLNGDEVKALNDFPDSIPYVGNVFYEHGNVVISAAEKYETIASGNLASDGFDLEFKNTLTTYEHSVFCTVLENEFNFTMNDSIRKKDEDGHVDVDDSVIDLATGSAFEPYVTTIGLYNDNRQLVAVGKLAKPIKNDPKLAMSFLVTIDA